MSDTSVGQVQGFFGAMNSYYKATSLYYQDPTHAPPNFMEVLPSIKFTQVITESQTKAKGNPTMVSGALIEACSSMFAVLREGAIRSKIRSDYFADAEGGADSDSTFYQTQGQSLVSFISGRNDMQS